MHKFKKQVHLNILKRLWQRLDGHCARTKRTCPIKVAKSLGYWPNVWRCEDCGRMFKGYAEIGIVEYRVIACPCIKAPGIAITRLAEYINELRKEIEDADM